MSFAVLHCSSDGNYFWHGETNEQIPYRNLERTLPVFLVAQMKAQPFDHLLVINGPGGFSQLRIACLCVNLLKTEYPTLKVSSWNKVDLMAQFHAQGRLPDHQLMFIGMKKKLWNLHIPSKKYELVTVSEAAVDTLEKLDCSLDMIENHLIFETVPRLHDEMITYGVDENGMTLEYHADISTLPRNVLFADEKVVEYLTPDYMIEPSIG